MSLINSDKLVMLSGFKAFANKCKRIFRPTYKKVTKNPYICITTSQAWTTNFECQFTINGLSNTNQSVISNAQIGLSNGTQAYGAVYNLTSLGIQSGKLTPINNKVALILEIPNLKSINVDASVFLNDKLYNVVDDITFLETCDYDAYQFGVNLNIEEDPDSIIIRNIGEGGSTAEFSIIDASGFTNNYRDGIQFNSIEKAGKLANSKNFRIEGAVTGQCSSDLSGEVYINTTLNTNDKNLSNLLDYKLSQVSVDKATTINYGTIKLGTNPSKTALNLKCDSTYGAYVEQVNQEQMPYLIQLDSIPTVAGDFSSGDIIQYVGESTHTLKNGFVYQASEYEDTKLNRTYYFNFGSTGLQKTDADYNSDNNPFKNIIDLLGGLSSITLKKKTDQEVRWVNEDKYLTNDYLLNLLGNTQSNKNLLDVSTSLTINILSQESAVEKKLLWEPKQVQEDATGYTYTAGTNIDITDYVVSATGYTYNSNNNSITLGSGTIASGENQVVMGTYNIENPDKLIIVGNGSENSRSTAYTLDTNGNQYVLGNTGYDVIYNYQPLNVIDINYASKKYNVYNPDQISESGITINVTTESIQFTGVREVVLHIFNRSTLDASLTINSADSGVCKCINNLPNTIPAGRAMEIIFTYLDSGYVTYKGWAEGTTAAQSYPIQIDTVDNVIITTDKTSAYYGDVVNITVQANTGYQINNVSALAGETKLTLTDLGNNRYSFVMPESKVSIKVDLLVITCTLTVNSDNGTITVTKDGVETTDTTFDYGTQLTLTATPDEHYHINQWPDGTNASTYTFNITENTTISGVFAINQYTVNISSTNGTVSGAGTYTAGTEVQISATPNDGYLFIKWSDEVTGNPRTITVNSDITLEAIFEQQVVTYTVSASASNGTVTGGGTYNSGDSCVLTVTPNEGYTFKQWSDDNTDNPRTIVVTQNMVLTAVCEKTIVVGQAIDLGLPSGTLWANMNIGATTPEEYGNYYAWGETKPKETYNWSTYQHGNSSSTLTKYNSTDGKTILEPEDDAATVNLGGTWRMPTIEEIQELIDNCTWTWKALNNINGYEVRSTNGNSIFLPAAGYYDEGALSSVGIIGLYWSSTLDTSGGLDSAFRVDIAQSDISRFSVHRFIGQSIRPVKSPQPNTEIYYTTTDGSIPKIEISYAYSDNQGTVCNYDRSTITSEYGKIKYQGDIVAIGYNPNLSTNSPFFNRDKYINSIELPDSIIYFGTSNVQQALSAPCAECSSLKSIKLSNNLQFIGYGAFNNCTSLETIVLPSTITTIKGQAFESCTSLKTINFPEGLLYIGGTNDYVMQSRAFAYCTSLTKIDLPHSILGIGGSSFYMCSNISIINYNGTIAEWSSVYKGSDWARGVATTVVHCTDGDVNI